MFDRFLNTHKRFMAQSLISKHLSIVSVPQKLTPSLCFLLKSYLINYLQIFLFPLIQLFNQQNM